MKPVRTITITFIASLLLLSMLLPVSAANKFSYSYLDSPFLTEEMKKYIELATDIKENDKSLIYFKPSFASNWYEGDKWAQIEDLADGAENYERELVVDTITGVDFYSFRNYNMPYDQSLGYKWGSYSNDMGYIAERLLSLNGYYRYNDEVYGVERIYWFNGTAELRIGGGYAAIVTDGGVFFEHYNLIYWKEDVSEYKVLTFTQEEFEEWYPKFLEPEMERRKANAGLKGGGSSDLGSFADFLTANGFTPRYGEAQGVTRRVLTYGGIGLVSAAIVGGSAYLIVRHKRKKKAILPEAEEIA